jgi:hypothetical protein
VHACSEGTEGTGERARAVLVTGGSGELRGS